MTIPFLSPQNLNLIVFSCTHGDFYLYFQLNHIFSFFLFQSSSSQIRAAVWCARGGSGTFRAAAAQGQGKFYFSVFYLMAVAPLSTNQPGFNWNPASFSSVLLVCVCWGAEPWFSAGFSRKRRFSFLATPPCWACSWMQLNVNLEFLPLSGCVLGVVSLPVPQDLCPPQNQPSKFSSPARFLHSSLYIDNFSRLNPKGCKHYKNLKKLAARFPAWFVLYFLRSNNLWNFFCFFLLWFLQNDQPAAHRFSRKSSFPLVHFTVWSFPLHKHIYKLFIYLQLFFFISLRRRKL